MLGALLFMLLVYYVPVRNFAVNAFDGVVGGSERVSSDFIF